MNQPTDSRSASRTLLEVLIPSREAIEVASTSTQRKRPKFRCGTVARSLAAESANPRCASTAISNIEKVSADLIRLSWSDSQSGRFSEQLWRLGRARQDSFCVLSGLPVRRGDRVFAPRLCKGYSPGNGDQVILETEVAGIPPSFVEHDMQVRDDGKY